MRVLIAGAGIGGLTCALSCARAGFEVSVFEQADEISEVGAGLQLSPNATRVLFRLGLEEALSKASFHPHSLDFRIGRSGRKVFSIPMESAAKIYGSPYLHIHRADLVEILKTALVNVAPSSLNLSKKVTGIDIGATDTQLTFSDWNSASGDIIVGADGIHSKIREEILGPDTPRFTGNVAWRAVIQANQIPKGTIPPSATLWTGHKRHAVTYYLRNGELINFVGIVEQNDWQNESWTEAASPEELRQEFIEFSEPIQSITKTVSNCFKWALHDRLPLSHWSQGSTTLLGDAAHPMLPFLAQGAAMAIEDAEALVMSLSQCNSNIPAALASYEAMRKPRTSRVQSASRKNMKLFHHGTKASELANYGPIWLASKIMPQFINSRQDWLYRYDQKTPIRRSAHR